MVEVKHKEAFEPPPFKGHGLPQYQIDARLKFYDKTGIRCMFLVFDKDGSIYWNWLDVLNKGNKYVIPASNIVIFDIKNFTKEKN